MGMLTEDWVFSYSQLSTFDECPYAFYLEKIERNPTVLSNAFQEQGLLIHDLIDQWAKGTLTKEELPELYKTRFPREVLTPFPRRMANYQKKAYDQGLQYFEEFDEFKGYKILDSEYRLHSRKKQRKCTGSNTCTRSLLSASMAKCLTF